MAHEDNNCKISLYFLPFLVMFGFSSLGAQAQSNGGSAPELVRHLAEGESSDARLLYLWRQELPIIDPLDYLQEPFKYSGFGRVAFLLEEMPLEKATEKGRLLWTAYFSPSVGMHPREIWLADAVWYAPRRKAYVVVVRSVSWDLRLQVYEVDPAAKASATPFPPVFDPSRVEEWPKGGDALSVMERTLLGYNVCGLATAKLSIEGTQLLLRGERDSKECPVAFLRFDLEKKEWSQPSFIGEKRP